MIITTVCLFVTSSSMSTSDIVPSLYLQRISFTDLKPGDIGMEDLPGASSNHIGYFVGFDENGRAKWAHSSSGAGCIALSGDAPQILEEYLCLHPNFTQEDAWALADDLNGLCGRMAPPVLPGDGKGHAGISSAIQLGDLFSRDTLLALPHLAGASPVTTWEINQVRLRGTDAELRDCLIGFLRNADNTVLGNGEAVRYLGEMAARYRMDTVRDMNGEKLREIARETLKRAKMPAVRRISDRSREAHVLPYDGWFKPTTAPALMVAEKAVSVRASGGRGIDR